MRSKRQVIWGGLASAMLALAAPSHAQDVVSSDPPTPVTDPDSWISAKDYPVEAGDRTDSVSVLLRIGPNGRVSECWMRQRATYQRFNDLTCQLLIARARFRPARDGDGKAIAGDFRHAYRWAPPEPDDTPHKWE